MSNYLLEKTPLERNRSLQRGVDTDNANDVRRFAARQAVVDDEKNPEALVIKETIVSIVAGMSKGNKDIVRRTIHLCSALASDEYPNGGVGWYNVFKSKMADCGWVSPEHGMSDYRFSHTRFTMDKVALDILKSALAASVLPGATADVLLKVATEAVDALKSDEEPLRLFESSSKTHKGAKFAIASSGQSAEGDVVMAMGAVDFSTSQNVTNVLFWEWSTSSVSVKRAESVMELSHELYEDVRETVESGTKEMRNDSLRRIKLKA